MELQQVRSSVYYLESAISRLRFIKKKKCLWETWTKVLFSALFLTGTQFEKQQEVMKRGAAAAESF